MFYFQSVFTFVVPVLISLLLYAVKQIKKKIPCLFSRSVFVVYQVLPLSK